MENFSFLRGGWITVNRGCNMRCSHCYQQDTEFDPAKNASLEMITTEVELLSVSGAKSVVVIGGEPTVYPHLVEVIKMLVAKNITPILVTNGRELSKESKIDRLLDAGLRHITVSIKADSESGYQEVTGTKGSLEKVIQAISYLKARNSVLLGISVTIEDYFVLHLENYLTFLLNLGVPHVNFDLGSPILKAAGVDITKIPNPFVLADAVERVHRTLKGTKLSYSFYMTIPLCILDKGIKNELVEDRRISTSCHVSKGNTAIFSEDGSVLPCNHFTDMIYGKLGEDFSTVEEFKALLNNEGVKQFRKEFNSFPHSNCSTCSDWGICGGGCKIKWMHYDPKDYIGKPRRNDHVETSQVFPITLQR